MKKYIIILVSLINYNVLAQVAIGKTQVDGNNTLLDFAVDNNTKGLIVPAVINTNIVKRGTTNENGIFVFDKLDARVKVFENNTWKNLSEPGVSTDIINYSSRSDKGTGGVIIGAETSTAEGVLILESINMAMILPKVFKPEKNVGNPYPGMICYDTSSHKLAVYNGIDWTYW